MVLSCRIDPVLGTHPNEYRPQPRLPARSGPTISFATALHTSRTSRHCTSFNTSSTTTKPLFLKIASAVASQLSVWCDTVYSETVNVEAGSEAGLTFFTHHLFFRLDPLPSLSFLSFSLSFFFPSLLSPSLFSSCSLLSSYHLFCSLFALFLLSSLISP